MAIWALRPRLNGAIGVGRSLSLDTQGVLSHTIVHMKPKPQMHAPADRALRTPKAVQTRVLAACFAGKSNRQISGELGVDRHTVGRILSQQEVRSLLEEYRQQARELVPGALAVLENKLLIKRGRPRARGVDWKMCVEILKGTQVFVGRTDQDITHKVDEIESLEDGQLIDFINEKLAGLGLARPGKA